MPVITANPPYADLLTKTEKAWKEFLLTGFVNPLQGYLLRSDGVTPLPVQMGVEDAALTRPLFICFCLGPAEVQGSSPDKWLVRPKVQVQTFKTEGAAVHRSRIAWLEDWWQMPDRHAGITDGYPTLAGLLTNHAEQYHCHGVFPEEAAESIESGSDGEYWVFTRGFLQMCQWVNGVA